MEENKPEDVPKIIKDVIDNLLKEHDKDDLLKVFKEKVPNFIERAIKKMQERSLNREQIDDTINNIYKKYCINRYLYHPNINGFYEIVDFQLKKLSSDRILLNLRHYIPESLIQYRTQIMRSLKANICKNVLVEWNPPKKCITRITNFIKQLFNSEDETIYFMTIIGGIVNNREDIIIDKDIIHMWYGPRLTSTLDMIQQLIYNSMCSYSSFWNRVKKRMHKYPLQQIWYLHFPKRNTERVTKVLKSSPELFICVCSYYFRTNTLSRWEKNPTICRTLSMLCNEDIFTKYLSTNLISKTRGYLQLSEIEEDFKEYLNDNKLPPNMLTVRELREYIEKQFKKVQNKKGWLYCGSLHVDSDYDIFERFTIEMLESVKLDEEIINKIEYEDDEEDDDLNNSDITENDEHYENEFIKKSHLITTQQLYMNYKMWHRNTIKLLNPNNEMCSINLFDTFLKLTYQSHENKWSIHLKSIQNYLKHYLSYYISGDKNNSTSGEEFKKWGEETYGIIFDKRFFNNNILNILKKNDIKVIYDNIIKYTSQNKTFIV